MTRNRMVGLMIGACAMIASAWMASGSWGANVLEVRDKNNVFTVFVSTSDTTAPELNGAKLDGSDLNRGTVPSARVSGSYTGITAVGTITSGVWNGTDIAVADGGTGAGTAQGARTNLAVPGLATENILTSTNTFQASDIGARSMIWNDFNGLQVASMTNNGSFYAQFLLGNGAGITGVTATPSGAAGGDLTGTFPNPTIAANAVALGVDTTGNYIATIEGGSVTVTGSGSESAAVTLGISPESLGAADIGPNAIGSSELAATTVVANPYGSATQVGTFTVDADGRLTAAADVTVTPAAASVAAGTFSGSFTFGSALVINNLEMKGATTSSAICSSSCTNGIGRCMWTSTSDGDVYTSTGSAAGQWRNGRTGTGACE